MDKIPPKELVDKESPKFSTFSENDKESSNPKRKRVLSLNDVDTEKFAKIIPKLNYKRCLLIDVTSEIKSKLVMICQTLNCSIEIAKDLEDARIIFENFIK